VCQELLSLLSPYQALAATAAFEVVGGPVGRVMGDLAAALDRPHLAEQGLRRRPAGPSGSGDSRHRPCRHEADGLTRISTARDPVIDARARSAYRERLIDLEDEIAEAVSFGDEGRAASLRTESDFLARELAGAIGLLGRSRSHAHPAERARQSVTKAIRAALARIDELDPGLGDHLRHAVRTGVMCSYSPDPHAAVTWTVVATNTLRPRTRTRPPARVQA
jgi:hypothetical protein